LYRHLPANREEHALTLPPHPQRRLVAGSYRNRESATLVVAKVSKQKIAIFLRIFIVRPLCLAAARVLSLVGKLV
jgi:hypothetical protein